MALDWCVEKIWGLTPGITLWLYTVIIRSTMWNTNTCFSAREILSTNSNNYFGRYSKFDSLQICMWKARGTRDTSISDKTDTCLRQHDKFIH